MLWNRASGFIIAWSVSLLVGGQVTWRRTYGGIGLDEAHSVRQTADGGYIIAGSTGSFGSGSSDIYVVKVDEVGGPIWTHVYGGLGVDNGVACRELSDGYIIAGSTSTGENGSYDMVLIRTDLQGESLWVKNYGTSAWDFCNSLEVLSDGFALGGITYGKGMVNGGAFIIRTNLEGDTLWTRTLDSPNHSECRSLVASGDQGIVIAGSIGTIGGPDDAFLAKFDGNGGQQWLTSFGGDSTDIFQSVIESPSEHFVACGTSWSDGAPSVIYIVGVDLNGQFEWSRSIGNSSDAGGEEICNRLNGGYVFTGYNTLNLGEKDMILTTTDIDGYFQFGNNFGDGNPAEGIGIDATADGGYIVAGWVEGYGPGLRAMYVVKSDSMGQTQNLSVQSYSDPLPVETYLDREHPSLNPTFLTVGENLCVAGLRAGRADVNFADVGGSILAKVQIQSMGRTLVKVPRLASGLYIVTVVQEHGTPFICKVLVQGEH